RWLRCVSSTCRCESFLPKTAGRGRRRSHRRGQRFAGSPPPSSGGAARTASPASSAAGPASGPGGSAGASCASREWHSATAACSSCISTPPPTNGGCTAFMTSAAGFVHLHVHSPFSFLDGAASIEELVQQAAALGMPALALTDHDNLSGAVRFVQAAEEA